MSMAHKRHPHGHRPEQVRLVLPVEWWRVEGCLLPPPFSLLPSSPLFGGSRRKPPPSTGSLKSSPHKGQGGGGLIRLPPTDPPPRQSGRPGPLGHLGLAAGSGAGAVTEPGDRRVMQKKALQAP